jgi:hypothetical protein
VDISTSLLLWGLLFGSVGFGYYLYGKKQGNNTARYTGIALMVLPYFVSNIIVLVVIGLMLMLLPRFIQW